MQSAIELHHALVAGAAQINKDDNVPTTNLVGRSVYKLLHLISVCRDADHLIELECAFQGNTVSGANTHAHNASGIDKRIQMLFGKCARGAVSLGHILHDRRHIRKQRRTIVSTPHIEGASSLDGKKR